MNLDELPLQGDLEAVRVQLRRPIVGEGVVASCYFRSTVIPPYRKALIKVTERCNLYCAHCFVSSGDYGDSMSIDSISRLLIPRLKDCRVISATLTGGEPFVHPGIIQIVSWLRNSGISVGICTNATLITLEQIEFLGKIDGVHLNVSMDGFRPESHGRFRGDQHSFAKTVETVRQLGERHLLQGLLVTPNNLAEVDEYAELCDFAIRNGATYVLMNPLSSMGRGVKSQAKLRSSNDMMVKIRKLTDPFKHDIEIVNIRFPNEQKFPLASCEAGNVIYIFTHGDVTVCPYLVFAAETPQSKHEPKEFIVGNIFKDSDIAAKLDAYKFHEQYQVGNNSSCRSCSLDSKCGKGCPAAVIAAGETIGQVDREVCPMEN